MEGVPSPPRGSRLSSPSPNRKDGVHHNASTGVDTQMGPFGIVPEWIWRHPEVNDAALRVWLALWSFADRRTNDCWPSRQTIAETADRSRTTVDRGLRILQNIGALTITNRKSGDGVLTSSHYQLKVVDPNMGAPPFNFGGTGTRENGDRGTRENGSENHNQLELEPVEPEDASTPSPRPRDVIWDTLVELFGAPSPDKRGAYGRTVAYLKDQGATPAEMIWRTEQLVLMYPENPKRFVTANSLRTNWTRFDGMVGRLDPAELASRIEALESERSSSSLLEKIAQRAAEAAHTETPALEAP